MYGDFWTQRTVVRYLRTLITRVQCIGKKERPKLTHKALCTLWRKTTKYSVQGEKERPKLTARVWCTLCTNYGDCRKQVVINFCDIDIHGFEYSRLDTGKSECEQRQGASFTDKLKFADSIFAGSSSNTLTAKFDDQLYVLISIGQHHKTGASKLL